MSPFLRPRRLDAPAVRLFGFHHAGGSASAYYRFVQSLPASWDALFLDLPGRGRRHGQSLPTGLGEVVEDAVTAMRHWLDRPFAMFGHSFGAVIAFEVARRLAADGTSPIWLGLSGRAPSYPVAWAGLADLDDRALADWMIEMGGTPATLRDIPELLERTIPVLRADLRCLEGYEPSVGPRPLNCPVTVFGAQEDRLAPSAQLEGWTAFSTGPVAIRRYPGHHFALLGDQMADYAQDIATDLEASLLRSTRLSTLIGGGPHAAVE